MADSKSGGNGWAVIVVLAIIGGGFLYQREGGKVFGPGGIIGLPVPRVVGLKASFHGGFLSYDLLLTNESAADLDQVDLTITLYREDGEKPVVKQFWSAWTKGEVKRINVPSHQYQKVVLHGTATQASEKRNIEDEWTWRWKDDAKDDARNLQGSWSLVAVEAKGEKAPEEQIKKEKVKVIISADKIIIKNVDRAEEFAYKIDSAKKMKTVDVVMVDRQRNGDAQLNIYGIYELNGDSLKVCCSVKKDGRPTAFGTKPDSEDALMIFKRDKQ